MLLLLTPGNMNDGTMAAALLEKAGPLARPIADKVYDTNALRGLSQCAASVGHADPIQIWPIWRHKHRRYSRVLAE